MNVKGKIVVITGASSGIGRALSVELGLRGATVVLVARSQDGLEETASLLAGYDLEHMIVPCDVTSEASIQNLIKTVIERYQTIDIFVNNAGVGLFEDVILSAQEDIDTVFATNLWGPLSVMRHIVPYMRGGMVVNISSAAAKYAPYRQGIYAASKAALERLTEAVGLEESHIKTLLVIPDRTDTPFMQNVVGPKERATLALQLQFASVEMVAKKIARAIEKEKRVCYTTLKARVYSMLSAVSPGTVAWILKKSLR